jgi:heme/copper-type cytochrome/quinol oxidase subunit 4
MAPNNTPGQTNINLHQQKLYALIMGAIGLLGMILPWATSPGFGGFGGSSTNGFQGWGILSLFGVIAILVSSLMNDKTQPYDQNMRYVAIGGFAALTLGAFIYFMQISGNRGGMVGLKSGIGLWFCIVPGIIGILWVTGVLKVAPSSTSTTNKPPSPPPAPPPPPSK